MKTSKPSTPTEEKQLLLNTENSPSILQSSDPIPIPEKKIFTRQNYL
jgi:hypothetical protein